MQYHATRCVDLSVTRRELYRTFGGGDPVRAVKQYAERIALLHIKDVESTGRAGEAGRAGEPGGAGGWAAQEQSGAAHADAGVTRRLAELNRDYEARFGYIFIVCATGKSASEMLAMLEERLSNDSDQELAIAAEQQRQIMRLRLAKLLDR